METIQFNYGQHAGRAMKSLYFQTLRIRLTWVFEIVLFVACTVFSIALHSRPLALIAAMVIIVSVLNYVTQVIVHPRRIRKSRDLNGQFEISFDANDFELKMSEGASKVEWGFFSKVWENKQYYFLFHNKRQYWIVPKEAFRNAEQEQLFRSIVQSHHQIATGVIR
ncbi:YcxB family protein [Paenibacillus glycanilyticus]|uniref:YcxB family protein n=1 Tax=Paenibacillus glycanilyticus TaxID=126569 RepID=UPI002041BCDF|nr:YcxB family protein [Paenibacillus glycanilyticus]MCM3629933.1 YcxB family protein [Paenibacillus glycanilyticus]